MTDSNVIDKYQWIFNYILMTSSAKTSFLNVMSGNKYEHKYVFKF